MRPCGCAEAAAAIALASASRLAASAAGSSGLLPAALNAASRCAASMSEKFCPVRPVATCPGWLGRNDTKPGGFCAGCRMSTGRPGTPLTPGSTRP
jgi:hypothetical protein